MNIYLVWYDTFWNKHSQSFERVLHSTWATAKAAMDQGVTLALREGMSAYRSDGYDGDYPGDVYTNFTAWVGRDGRTVMIQKMRLRGSPLEMLAEAGND